MKTNLYCLYLLGLLAAVPASGAATVDADVQVPLDEPEGEGSGDYACVDVGGRAVNATRCANYLFGVTFFGLATAEKEFYDAHCILIRSLGGECREPDYVFYESDGGDLGFGSG